MDVGFTKMQGSGNDFVLVDEWGEEAIPKKRKEDFVRKVCDRHFGVGSDGLIFVQKSETEDANFVFYNPDGSRAEMCGNGIRCFAKYLYEKGHIQKEGMSVETLAGVISLDLTVEDGEVKQVKAGMGSPQTKRGQAQVAGEPEKTYINQKTMIHGFEYGITAVGMGNPHAVIFYDNIEQMDVKEIGYRVRSYRKLFPNGTNVHFVQELGENKFKIRTYERGVEDETLACGTGICASAVAAVLNEKATSEKPIVFEARGGRLKVEMEVSEEGIKGVYLIGPAHEVFKGTYPYDCN